MTAEVSIVINDVIMKDSMAPVDVKQHERKKKDSVVSVLSTSSLNDKPQVPQNRKLCAAAALPRTETHRNTIILLQLLTLGLPAPLHKW